MEIILTRIVKELIFWMAWVIIPLLWEIIPAIGGFFILIKKIIKRKKYTKPIIYPAITMIVPVYNSETTLKNCIKSIYDSDYPSHQIEVFLVDNGSKDNSYRVFLECQTEFSDLSLWWMSAEQGKSKALNLALFNSSGKYIINIDSDGVLEKTALTKMVEKFEENMDINGMTGTILIIPELIENTEELGMLLIRRCEFFEYCNAFMAGRNYESEFGNLYTMSGAFSAFRKSAILKTFLYNSVTVGEDTHVTFQLRFLLNYDIKICEDALFFVDPIDDVNKLYTQRQRWQRGEIEVSNMFLKEDLKVSSFFSNFMVRILMYDHTFAFPRTIWYFAIIYLIFINYPIYLVIGSLLFLYLLYAMSSYLFYFSTKVYIKEFEDLHKYYKKIWYVPLLYPIFNNFVFFIRFAGIINSIKSDVQWKTRDLTEEKIAFKEVIQEDFEKFKKILKRLNGRVNNG